MLLFQLSASGLCSMLVTDTLQYLHSSLYQTTFSYWINEINFQCDISFGSSTNEEDRDDYVCCQRNFIMILVFLHLRQSPFRSNKLIEDVKEAENISQMDGATRAGTI